MGLHAIGKRPPGKCCKCDDPDTEWVCDPVAAECVEAGEGESGFETFAECSENCGDGGGDIKCQETHDSATGITTRNCVNVGAGQGDYESNESCESAGCDFPVYECITEDDPNGPTKIRHCELTMRANNDADADENCKAGQFNGDDVPCCCCEQIKVAELRPDNEVFFNSNGTPKNHHGNSGDKLTLENPAFGDVEATLTITNMGTCLSHGGTLTGTLSVTALNNTTINQVKAGISSTNTNNATVSGPQYDSGQLNGVTSHSGSVTATIDLAGECFNPVTRGEYEVPNSNPTRSVAPEDIGFGILVSTNFGNVGGTMFAQMECCECVSSGGTNIMASASPGPGSSMRTWLEGMGADRVV